MAETNQSSSSSSDSLITDLYNDPLYIHSLDHPGLVLTRSPFDGTYFFGWSRGVQRVLGAKLKLGFINGRIAKPESSSPDYQRWVYCDYLVTCWVLNSMWRELSDTFINHKSAHELWTEIIERFSKCKGLILYHLEREVMQITQCTDSIASYFSKLKRCWDELRCLNGIPACTSGKLKECSCAIMDKILQKEEETKLIQFLMKLNDDYNGGRTQILAMEPLPSVIKAYHIVQRVEKLKEITNPIVEPSVFLTHNSATKNLNRKIEVLKFRDTERKVCDYCKSEGHLFEHCSERVGYPDWFEGRKKGLKPTKPAAYVHTN